MPANRRALRRAALLPALAGLALAAGPVVQAQPVAAELPPRAEAVAPDAPMSIESLLSSSARHSPQILEQLARMRSADGKRLSVEGAFDTLFSTEATTRATGYYDGATLDAKVTKPLENWGGQVYGGYRVSRGDFPIYEDKSYTNRAGELRVGAVFSLMRDRLIDDRRFARTQADAEIAIADAERQMVAIGVQRRALDAYAAWVAAGQRTAIHRDMVQLAEERQQGLRRAVEAGLRPGIILVENEQNILRRRSLLVQAEQALAVAANTLSLYWRDEQGKPRTVQSAQPPAQLPYLPVTMSGGQRLRPDLLAAEMRERLVRDRLQLDRNALLPRLDLEVEGSRDFGAEGAGGPSRFGTELRFGLRFSIPLEQRAARGRIAQTEADIEAAMRRAQWLDEQIGAEIQALEISSEALDRVLKLSQEEKARADTMAQAERRRFSLGASDLFLVNTREEAAASAALALVDVQVRRVGVHADLLAAAGDAKALGLE